MNIMFIFIVNALHISDVLDECDFVHRMNLLERMHMQQNWRGEWKLFSSMKLINSECKTTFYYKSASSDTISHALCFTFILAYRV